MKPSFDFNKQYTFAEYLEIADNEMGELIHGILSLISPIHCKNRQSVSKKLTKSIEHYIEKHKLPFHVFRAPFNVRLFQEKGMSDEKVDTVLHPSICVVCDPSQIDKKGCIGAPDLIIEIQENRTPYGKFNMYQEAGIREYWQVNTRSPESIDVFILQSDGKYGTGKHYQKTEKIPVHIFDEWEIDLKHIF